MRFFRRKSRSGNSVTTFERKLKSRYMGRWEPMEALGARVLLSVTIAPNGYTLIEPSADSHVIYVSNSQGSDANDGLSPTSPVKTIAKGQSLLRYGMPDQLLLKRGDTFNESFGNVRLSGRSASEPQVIGAYGTGARPVIASGTDMGIMTGYYGGSVNPIKTCDNLAIMGLDFYANGRDPALPGADLTSTPIGMYFTTNSHWMLVEDCMVRGYKDNVVINAGANTTFRRNIIVDSFATNSHSQGMYIEKATGVILEGNVFDHNGWREGVAGAEQTIFNHNIYVTGSSGPVTVRGNVIANASSHGLQARSGGDVINNLFYNNAIGMSFGLVNGAPATAGGVSGRIEGNVFLGGHSIAGSARGWAIEIGNTTPKANGGGTVVKDNIITNDTQNAFAAIQLSYGSNVTNASETVGINDLTIEHNIVYKWYQAVAFNRNLLPGQTGTFGLNGLIIKDNDFQLSLNGKSVDHAAPFLGTAESWEGNRYAVADVTKSFLMQGNVVGMNAWIATVEPTAVATQVAYPAQDRTLSGYNVTIGGAADEKAFFDHLRQQSASSYDAGSTAGGVIAYMQEGFFGYSLSPTVCILPMAVPLQGETAGGSNASPISSAPSPLESAPILAAPTDKTNAATQDPQTSQSMGSSKPTVQNRTVQSRPTPTYLSVASKTSTRLYGLNGSTSNSFRVTFTASILGPDDAQASQSLFDIDRKYRQ